jgi:hypothetical protein
LCELDKEYKLNDASYNYWWFYRRFKEKGYIRTRLERMEVEV